MRRLTILVLEGEMATAINFLLLIVILIVVLILVLVVSLCLPDVCFLLRLNRDWFENACDFW